jgi:Zn-dependent protease
MDIAWFFITLAIIVGSVVLHEMAHGVVAYWLGDDTAKEAGRLSLNPLKHIDPVMSIAVPMIMFLMGGVIFGGAKPVPIDTRNLRFREWGMALVAIAGPLTNLILAFLACILLRFGGFGDFANEVLLTTAFTNLGFFVFNLIPIPPLDGSRLLFAIAPEFLKEFMLKIEQFGMVIVFGLILIVGSAFSTFLYHGVAGIFNGMMWILGG